MIVEDWLYAVLRGQPAPWKALAEPGTALLATCDALEASELLHYHVKRNPATCDWPDDVRRELARRTHASTARQLVRTAEIAGVLHALASHGIHPIVFKGAAVSHVVYDSPGLRPHTDTDLFVRRSNVDSVREILTERGYTEPLMTGGELVFCQFQMMKTDRVGIRHVFDIHWKISTQSLFADLLAYDELDADAVPVAALGSHGRAAGGSHALLIACIHPVMHHRNVDRLIWQHDIHLLLQQLPAGDVRRFASLAVSKGVAGICARQIALVSERFHTFVPEDVLSALSDPLEREPSAIYLKPRRRWHHEMVWNLRGLGDWGDRLRLLREVLFPAPRYMLDSYHLGGPGVLLLPVLYLHRGVYGAFKIIVGWK